jgi:hypothetical protein
MHVVTSVVGVNFSIFFRIHNLRGALDFKIQLVYIFRGAIEIFIWRKKVEPSINMVRIFVQLGIVVVNRLVVFGIQFGIIQVVRINTEVHIAWIYVEQVVIEKHFI